jgi:hypothetical protein
MSFNNLDYKEERKEEFKENDDKIDSSKRV